MFLLISTRAWLPILILVGARNPKLIYREPKSRLFQFPSWDLISKTTWCGSEWRETNNFSLPFDSCTISFHNKVPWGPPDGSWLWFSISADLYNLLQILPWMWLSNTRDKFSKMTSVNWNNKLSSEFSCYILPEPSYLEMYFFVLFLFFFKPSPSFKCDSFSCYSCLFGSTDSLVGVWTENSPALKIQGAALVGSFFFRHRWYNPWSLHGVFEHCTVVYNIRKDFITR